MRRSNGVLQHWSIGLKKRGFHCGLWEEPRAPARAPPVAAQASLELRYEADPDYVPAPEEP
jgi:hypothetical protein